jgi:hypothetical protein
MLPELMIAAPLRPAKAPAAAPDKDKYYVAKGNLPPGSTLKIMFCDLYLYYFYVITN